MLPRPLTNRVTPTGRIIADPARGLFMGNRGILHDEKGRLGRARWRHKAWITCRLMWKDWHRDVMQPGAYTELFFLDEAVALAAGHRPCALCRREAFYHFKRAIGHTGSAKELDDRLHRERAIPRRFEPRHHTGDISRLPDGAMCLIEERTFLVRGEALLPFSMSGYQTPVSKPKSGLVTVLTPPTSVTALRNGFEPVLHETAL